MFSKTQTHLLNPSQSLPWTAHVPRHGRQRSCGLHGELSFTGTRYQRALGSCTRSLPQPNLTLKKTKPSSFLTSHTTSGRALREGRYGQVVEGGIQRAAKRGKGKQRWDEGEEVMQVGSEHLSQSRARDQGVQARKNEEDPWEYRKMARESCTDNQLTKWKAVENAGCRTPGANC